MNGKYKISTQTPMGNYQGILTLTKNNSQLNGMISFMNMTLPLNNGKINGDNFEFVGQFKYLIKTIPFKAVGTVNGNNITAKVFTNLGSVFHIKGTKMQ